VDNTFYAAWSGKVSRFDSAAVETLLTGTLNGTEKVFWARNNKATPDVVCVAPGTGAFTVTTAAVSAFADIDVRVISATNRSLTEMIAAGQFREDLFYRLNVIQLHVPPLRERVEDVQPLVKHFLAKSGRSITLTPEAWRTMERYPWPGNVRQLQNVGEQMIWLSATSQSPIDVGQLPAVVRTTGPSIKPAKERRRQFGDELYKAIVEGGYTFWTHVHPLFLDRDLTRHDLRMLVSSGLSATKGNYRTLVESLGMPASDYKRFMNFLAAHECTVDYRQFRAPNLTVRPTQLSMPLDRRITRQSTES
jgi:DNA-binding NtrC family response regulator